MTKGAYIKNQCMRHPTAHSGMVVPGLEFVAVGIVSVDAGRACYPTPFRRVDGGPDCQRNRRSRLIVDLTKELFFDPVSRKRFQASKA